MATFSERLRELRTQYDYSQQDLADKMDLVAWVQVPLSLRSKESLKYGKARI